MKEHNDDIFYLTDEQPEPVSGALLVAKPTVDDDCFGRSVILLIDHDKEGTMGLMLNRPTTLMLNDAITLDRVLDDVRLYLGGPVNDNVMFYIHTLGSEIIPDSMEVLPGLYFAGDFEALKLYIECGGDVKGKVKFFAGYSGWVPGQLDDEIARYDWAVLDASDVNRFVDDASNDLWQWAVEQLGKRYRLWNNWPIDPNVN